MSICLRRRDFIAALGGASAWPLAARGQQRTPIVGVLGLVITPAFVQRLKEEGLVAGQNVAFETRWSPRTGPDVERLPELAADLVRRPVQRRRRISRVSSTA